MSQTSLVIVPYRSFGTGDTLYVRGRVLHDELPVAAEVEQSPWRNLRDTLRRIESDEARGVPLSVTCGAQSVQTITNNEGYFEAYLSPVTPSHDEDGWCIVTLAAPDAVAPDAGADVWLAQAAGEVLIPPATARFGVISDIDDTILQTQATNLVRSAWVTLLQNAATRQPFPGVAALYRALQRGVTGADHNPIFYVSSSPWNLYDFLIEFMQVRGIPAGPIFLRDYGIDMLTQALSHDHKLDAMRRVLDAYPHLPFVLMGDSGQKDPELYTRLAEQYPGRVLAIYIRDVSGEKRDAAVDAMATALRAQGVLLLRVADSLAAAQSAAAMGLIDSAALEVVRAATPGEEGAHVA
jgi:phosphatidate phosphatase APP1